MKIQRKKFFFCCVFPYYSSTNCSVCVCLQLGAACRSERASVFCRPCGKEDDLGKTGASAHRVGNWIMRHALKRMHYAYLTHTFNIFKLKHIVRVWLFQEELLNSSGSGQLIKALCLDSRSHVFSIFSDNYIWIYTWKKLPNAT